MKNPIIFLALIFIFNVHAASFGFFQEKAVALPISPQSAIACTAIFTGSVIGLNSLFMRKTYLNDLKKIEDDENEIREYEEKACEINLALENKVDEELLNESKNYVQRFQKALINIFNKKEKISQAIALHSAIFCCAVSGMAHAGAYLLKYGLTK